MGAIGTVAAVVLGAVFVVAAGSKLAAGAAWPAQARSLGAPPPVAVALPGIELVVGALLITTIAMPVPAVLAIVLLIGFSVLIARQLVNGRHPPCACFGAWSSRPLDESHLVRNAALVMLAVIALWAR
ncbi:MAG: MauE/DoxX family redox-associated membrane protein [Ilumatobacteraceae bacterium]